MFIIILLLVVGFVILIKGADWLVDGASSIAKRFKVSDLVIGLTIVAFGTSAPELIVNILSSISGSTEIAIGNVIGSNIVNILLILGIAAVIYPLKVGQGTAWKEIPLSLMAAVMVGIFVNDAFLDGSSFSGLTATDGFALLGFFIIFLYYTFGIAKINNDTPQPQTQVHKTYVAVLFILLGLAALILGGKLVVDNAVKIAQSFGVSESLIGLTIVAIGTSLPELATSAVAAYKKNVDIAVGNVVGSNIFNIFWILGISSVISPLPVSPSSNIDIGMAIFASFLLFLWLFIGKKHHIERWQGAAMIIIYIGYIVYLIMRG